jgi:hypothetical protein
MVSKIEAGIDPGDLELLRIAARQLNKAGPDFKRQFRLRAADEIEVPLVAKIKGRATGPHGPAAASTVSVARGAVPGIWLGKGSGLGAAVAMGAEWGGRKDRKVQVIRRTKNSRIIYRRRTTMQFREHLGRRGYWLAPTMRAEGPQTVERFLRIVTDVLADIPGAEVTE